jgi:hypothetical protein
VVRLVRQIAGNGIPRADRDGSDRLKYRATRRSYAPWISTGLRVVHLPRVKSGTSTG